MMERARCSLDYLDFPSRARASSDETWLTGCKLSEEDTSEAKDWDAKTVDKTGATPHIIRASYIYSAHQGRLVSAPPRVRTLNYPLAVDPGPR